MSKTVDPAAALSDLVVRCVLVYERDGQAGLDRELATAGELAAPAREQMAALQAAGLLLPPEQPEQIGPYRVLQRLGSGGMGAVYLCEQQQPLRRRVAVKVLRPGMDSREIVARFALERQALSLLEHPGIARVHDAGSTAAGRPFLVIEYIPGLPLHRYCDERQLPARARLELFVRICDAVQHAHHKGIVHRDLKPSNVLVVDRDGAPWPVVIDFGVAKSLTGVLNGATMMTLPGRMLGTPKYMSPEQATNDQDVDTRTDVYSLGVILYELLTGTLPIDGDRLRRAGDVAQVLREVEPPTPSTRITTLGDEAANVALRRGTDAAGLRRLLRGDLDWIVLKALEKDRNRRYGMPGELAADVRCHLANQPVSAARPSTWYRFSKYCARHRLQAAAAGLVLGALATGLGVSLWFWRQADASSQSSQASLDDALAAVSELVQVGDSDLVSVPHLEGVRRSLLERSVAFYRKFLGRAPVDDPRLLPATADALVRLGAMQVKLGQHEEALPNLREGLQRHDQLAAQGQPVPAEQFVRALFPLSEACERRGEQAAAIAALQRAEQLLRPLHAADPDDARLRAMLLRTRRNQGKLVVRTDPAAALAAFDEAVALAAPFAAAPEANKAHLPDVVQAGTDHARQLLEFGRRDEALAELVALRDLLQRATATAEGGGTDWALTTAASELAALFGRCDRTKEALAMLDAAAAAYERLVKDHANVLAYRIGLATTRSERAADLMRGWRIEEGLKATVQAEHDHLAALALAPGDVSLQHNAAFAAVSLTQALIEAQRQGQPADLPACRAANERALAVLDRMAATPQGRKAALRPRAEALRQRALLADPPGGPAAIADLGAAIVIVDELLTTEPDSRPLRERRIELRHRLADAQLAADQAAAARALVQAALDEHAAMRGQTDSPEIWTMRRRAMLIVRARAEAALGDVEGLFACIDAHRELALNLDWQGRQEAARLLVTLVGGPLAGHARRAEVAERARVEARAGLAAGEQFVQSDHTAGPAMIAVMRANNWQILADLEHGLGNTGAEAEALGEVAAQHQIAFANGSSERAELRLRDTCDKWGDALLRGGNAPAAAAALGRMGTWFTDRPNSLVAAAACAGRFVKAHPDAHAVRSAGQELLRAALAAGYDAEAAGRQEELQALSNPRER